ncbi:diaminobutyrate acetyltransferase [Streptomyces sp. TRM64462]|uniref:diaminobutyrate acetyltransferase n=1 Tax=Streptomyces sp. TRM64462 TaxID=2741726 RepID=UPI001586F0D0|nr:diaminobutyrate acetyltransferase [Streptomyces sp. TRM64462]
MTAAQADLARARNEFAGTLIDSPRVEDGAAIWRIARDSEVLDLNSSYSYLLWCRDFAATSVVARDTADGEPIAFVTGYLRPDRPGTLVVWQVAVDHGHRGRGLAGTLLEALATRVSDRGVHTVETTITPDNTASDRLFTSFAERRGASLEREVLFDGGLFPEGTHQPEVLYRIAPIAPAAPTAPTPPTAAGARADASA